MPFFVLLMPPKPPSATLPRDAHSLVQQVVDAQLLPLISAGPLWAGCCAMGRMGRAWGRDGNSDCSGMEPIASSLALFPDTNLQNDSLEVTCWSGSPAGLVVTPHRELVLSHPVIIGSVFWLVWAMEEFCNIFMYIPIPYVLILSQLKWLSHVRRKEKNKSFRSCRIKMAFLNQSSSDGSVIMDYLPRPSLLLRAQKLPRCLALVN